MVGEAYTWISLSAWEKPFREIKKNPNKVIFILRIEEFINCFSVNGMCDFCPEISGNLFFEQTKTSSYPFFILVVSYTNHFAFA